jgi:hypothetical protein
LKRWREGRRDEGKEQGRKEERKMRKEEISHERDSLIVVSKVPHKFSDRFNSLFLHADCLYSFI